jgi:hypothetical protein
MAVRWSIEAIFLWDCPITERRLTMHLHFHEQLARQRREELLRDAATTRPFTREERTSSDANNRALLSYLLFGQALPTSKQLEHQEQTHSTGLLRMVGLVALALGVLAGSLLDSRFGLAPAVVADGAVVLVLMGLAVSRSVRLMRMRQVRNL